MKAIIFESPDHPCEIKNISLPEPAPNEVRIRLKAASLNRRDYWIKKGIYMGASFPCVAGSDGAGIVDSTGSDAHSHWLGKSVLINPALHWGENRMYHSEKFHILGLPSQGTFAQYVCVPADHIYEIPSDWSFEKASALPLAGLTAYRALFTRGNLRKDEKVLITGAGGGVASFLIKYASVGGASVFVTSSSGKKIKKAMRLGAQSGVLYNKPEWSQQLKDASEGGFDLIIDSAAGENFARLTELLKTGGRIVIFGGTAGKIPSLTAAKIFWRQASILGTTMGSPQDFEDMLAFVTENALEPEIDTIFPMADMELAFKHMENHEQFGKIVVKISEED